MGRERCSVVSGLFAGLRSRDSLSAGGQLIFDLAGVWREWVGSDQTSACETSVSLSLGIKVVISSNKVLSVQCAILRVSESYIIT
jgi:hypothetical protein